MKRFLCLMLVLSTFLPGCRGDRIKEPVRFYYVRSNYQEDLASVIASEEREASGHLGELSYLMALYLMGPVSEQFVSPIPPGTQIFVKEIHNGHITLKLSDTAKTMTDAEFSLACACLSYTCLDITEAREITITSGTRSVTMSSDNLELWDNTIITTTEEPT